MMWFLAGLVARAATGAAARGLASGGSGVAIGVEIKDHASPFLMAVFNKQLPFATSVALNETAKDFQKAQRARLSEVFTLRRRQWAEQSVKIKPFATKARQEVRISIDPPGGRGDILGKFETDTVKRPRGEHVAVPVEARRSASGIVSARDRPRRVISEGRAFIRKVGGRAAIFERLKTRTANKLGKTVRLLYTLVHQVPIKPELRFVRTAEETVQKRWQINFAAAFARAIRTAK